MAESILPAPVAGRAAPRSTLGLARSTSTGTFATFLFFVLCWAFAALALPFPNMFIGLFTSEPIKSASSLWIGGLTAFVAGGIAGMIIAHCYNLAGRFFND